MKSKQEFIERWKHDLGGMLLDASTVGAKGPALSLWVAGIMEKVERRLGQYYDDLAPVEPIKPEPKQPAKDSQAGYREGIANGKSVRVS